jgi:hypothetical protein
LSAAFSAQLLSLFVDGASRLCLDAYGLNQTNEIENGIFAHPMSRNGHYGEGQKVGEARNPSKWKHFLKLISGKKGWLELSNLTKVILLNYLGDGIWKLATKLMALLFFS